MEVTMGIWREKDRCLVRSMWAMREVEMEV